MGRDGKRLLIVGEAPNRTGAGRQVAFAGSASARRLEGLLGLQPGELPAVARSVNLFEALPSSWSRPAARAQAARQDLAGVDVLVLCGRRVADAFGLQGVELLAEVAFRGRRALVMPHPSQASRWWNDPENRRRARLALRSLGSGRDLFS